MANTNNTKRTTVEAGGCTFTLVPAKATTAYDYATRTETKTAAATKRADDSWLVVDRSGNVIGLLQGEDDDWNVLPVKSRNLSTYELRARAAGWGKTVVEALAMAFGVATEVA